MKLKNNKGYRFFPSQSSSPSALMKNVTNFSVRAWSYLETSTNIIRSLAIINYSDFIKARKVNWSRRNYHMLTRCCCTKFIKFMAIQNHKILHFYRLQLLVFHQNSHYFCYCSADTHTETYHPLSSNNFLKICESQKNC